MTGQTEAVRWPEDFEVAGIRATLLGDGDSAVFPALYGNPATMQQIGDVLDRPATMRAFAAARRQMRADPPVARYWCLDAGADVRGLLSLVPDTNGRTAETGLLLPPALQARGVATAVLGHLRDAVLGTGALDALWTRHRAGHAAAAGLMRRLGFEAQAPADGWQRWRLHRNAWCRLVGHAAAD
ncbi:GNAT family N-acetyltransferase [Luteimonas terrae]|uniref:GNAT family N-acetyltransferase n=1 Tax=Luteimonas terrae TaxID=1530191 RepID=A0A4R5UCC3_9GAMM|nr:GNAT family N-acetyltransferase [Luteimonas terrae]TDK32915.1 GNAT family N-acetyltransferase [Luteimonas terrae]